MLDEHKICSPVELYLPKASDNICKTGRSSDLLLILNAFPSMIDSGIRMFKTLKNTAAGTVVDSNDIPY